MKNRIKQILAYILMITIIMGNTVSASAATAGSYLYGQSVENAVQEIVFDENAEESATFESTTEEATAPESTTEEGISEPSEEYTTEETSTEEISTEETTTEDSAIGETESEEITSEEIASEETTSEEMTSEETSASETDETTTDETTTDEATAEEMTSEEETTEMMSSEELSALETDGDGAENVYLYSAIEKDGEYVEEGSFASLQSALDAIEVLAAAERFYRVEMVSAEAGVVTSQTQALNMPKQTAGLVITGGSELTEPFIYFKGTLKLKSNVIFEDIIFVPTGKTTIALGAYELTLTACRIDDQNGGMIGAVNGSGIKENSKLILDDTNLRVNGAVNNVGTIVFAGSQGIVPAVSSLTADGKINIGNVELKTGGCLTGAASVTRKNGKITKIEPQITIGGEVCSETEQVLYLDLTEKKDGTYRQLDLDKEDAAEILTKGVSFAKAQKITYPHIKAVQRNEADELVKAGGFLKYFSNGYGVVLSYLENGVEEQIPCYTFNDAVTEINNRKVKQDYVITLTKDSAVTSGIRQDILTTAPKALTMPDKKYVNSLVIQADPEADEEITLGFTGNITFTSPTTLRGINFVQMVKSGAKYVKSDAAKDGYAAAVTLKTGGFDLTIEERITFNTPLVLNGGNKGDLIIKEDAVIHTLTHDWEPEGNSRNVVIFGSITGVDEFVFAGRDITLNEYRNSRTGTKYTASVNKFNTLTLTDAVLTVNGANKVGSLTVKDLYIDNGEVAVGGKAILTNVTLEGSQKALVSADTEFKISGILTSKSNNATLLTRLKGAGKAPYLNISGSVVREKGILPLYVGVYPENNVAQKNRDRAVELKNAPKVTAQLLTAKNALAVDFRPIAQNYPWGSGEYNKDNTSGYMMMKSGNNVYVYEGSKVKVAVYVKEEADTEAVNAGLTNAELTNGELFGYFSSLKTATTEVNKAKNKNAVYTYVLMEVNGTAASPTAVALPSHAKQVIVKSLDESSEAVKTITFSGGITFGTETVFEDIVLAPVKNKKSTAFTLNGNNKSLTLKNVDIPGSITKAGTLIVQGDSVVKGNVETACLRLLNAEDDSATVMTVKGNVNITTLENYGETANILTYTRTSQNVTRLTVKGQIINEYADKPVVLRQNYEKATPVLVKKGVKVTLKDANKLAVMPKASTDSFVLEASATDAEGTEITAENLRTVKAGKGIYRIDTRDTLLAGRETVLQSITDRGTTLTYCLDYNQAVNEINNRADKTAQYTIYFGTDDGGIAADTNVTDANQYSAFPLPKKNTKASLAILPEGGAAATLAFTGNVTGYGVIALENIVLQPVKGAANDAPVNTVVTLQPDSTGASLYLNGITTKEQKTGTQQKRGYISNIKGTKNKTELTLDNCGEMLVTAGISNIKALSLKNTKLLSGKNSAVTGLTMDDLSAWVSIGKLTLTDVSAPEGVTEAYVGVKQDIKKKPQLTVNGSVTGGALLVRLYESDTAVSDGMEILQTTHEKEIDSYLNESIALAPNADAAGFRAYAYRVTDTDGTIAENADGVSKDNFASYKDGDYVKNGTQDAMFLALGSAELKKLAVQAKEELERLALEKELYALIYMTDFYDVKEEASHESATVVTLASGHTVQILSMDVEWTYSEEWEEYIPNIWYYVQFYVGETLCKGYVEENFLAYSDELLLQWKNDWSMLFPLENTLFAEVNAASYSDVNQFPVSYQASLNELKKAHPNWTFVPMNVGRNWSDCVDEQMQGDYSLIYYNQPAEFRRGSYDGTWYYASRAGVEYYMDPRNFLTESNIFQFEQNTYNASYHTQSALQNFLNGTFMAGTVPGAGRTYANVIWKSGADRGLSPFNLAARVIQEQGVNGTSPMISGTYSGYEGYYNHYNIQASGKTNEEVFRSGLAYAKKMGWNTRVKSLEGGAAFIGNGYILQGQDTLYLQKFDVNHGNSSLHQYMQNIMAPYSEGRSMKSMYTDAGSLNSNFVFKIPVFNNMSQDYSLSPTYVKLKKGKTQQLTVKCGGAVVSSDKITYSSDNTAVATVSSTGLIKAVGTGSTTGEIGKATITVKIEGFDKELKCKVEVVVPLEKISLSIEEDTLYSPDELSDQIPVLENGVTKYIDKADCPTQTTLNVTYIPADTTDSRKVKWTVADPEIVEVVQDPDNVGKATVIAKSGGKTMITAKVGNCTSAVSVTVRVPMTEAYLKMDENSITMYKGERTRVNVFYAPYGTTDQIEPVWSSSDETVAKIVDGDIVAVGKGTATLYANVGPFVGAQSDVTGLSCKVTVKEYTVTFMDADGSVWLTATGEYGSTLEHLTASGEIPWQQEKDGYIFAGWYTEENGNGYAVNEKTLLHGDMVLYPYFIDVTEGFYAKPIGYVNYTGAYLKPDVEVYSGETLLTRGVDYTVVYVNNKAVNDPSDAQLRPTAIIYGRDAYGGNQYRAYFDILPKDISHSDVTAGNLLNAYSGKEQQMEPVLYDGGRTLQKNIDYTLTYPENDKESGAYSEAGSYEVVATGVGNYSGSRTLTVTLSKRTLMSRTSVGNIADMKFNNGKKYTTADAIADCVPSSVKVTYNGSTLVENVDYTLSYEDNREIGTAKVIVTGIGDYIGTKTKTFRITGTALSTVTVKGIANVDYTGETAGPDLSKIKLTNKQGVLLREGLDYTLICQERTDAGRVYITLTGINGYTGTLKKTFVIKPYDIGKNDQTYRVEGEEGTIVEKPAFEIAMDETPVEYDKAGAKKAVVVTFKGKILTEGKDYMLAYVNDNAVTDEGVLPTIKVTGIGNFTGNVNRTFSVMEKDLTKVTMTVKNVAFRNRKGFCFAEPLLTDESGRSLSAGKDYEEELVYTYETDTTLYNGKTRQAGETVLADDIPTAGSVLRVSAVGKGNYTGSISCTFEITESSSLLEILSQMF